MKHLQESCVPGGVPEERMPQGINLDVKEVRVSRDVDFIQEFEALVNRLETGKTG